MSKYSKNVLQESIKRRQKIVKVVLLLNRRILIWEQFRKSFKMYNKYKYVRLRKITWIKKRKNLVKIADNLTMFHESHTHKII